MQLVKTFFLGLFFSFSSFVLVQGCNSPRKIRNPFLAPHEWVIYPGWEASSRDWEDGCYDYPPQMLSSIQFTEPVRYAQFIMDNTLECIRTGFGSGATWYLNHIADHLKKLKEQKSEHFDATFKYVSWASITYVLKNYYDDESMPIPYKEKPISFIDLLSRTHRQEAQAYIQSLTNLKELIAHNNAGNKVTMHCLKEFGEAAEQKRKKECEKASSVAPAQQSLTAVSASSQATNNDKKPNIGAIAPGGPKIVEDELSTDDVPMQVAVTEQRAQTLAAVTTQPPVASASPAASAIPAAESPFAMAMRFQLAVSRNTFLLSKFS